MATQSDKKNESIWTKNFLLALLVCFTVNLTFNMLNSTIGLYAKGFTNVEMLIGLTASGFTGAALATKLGAGKLLEKFSIKPIILTGMALSIFSSACYLLVHDIYAIIAVRIFHGLSFGITSVACTTALTACLPRDRLLEGVGYNMMLTTLTTAIGPAIVLNVTDSRPERFLYAFILLIILFAIGFLAALPIKPQQSMAANIDCIGRMNLTMATWFVAILAILGSGAQTSITVYLNLYALEKGFGNMTPYFVLFALTNFTTRFVMGKLTHWITERQFLYFTGFSAIVVLMTVYLAPNAYYIFGAAVLFGMSMGVMYPILSTKVIKSLSWRKQGLANAINGATMELSNVAGVTLWSILATRFGTYAFIYPVAAGMMVLFLVVLTIYPSLLRKMNVPEESEC